MNVPVGATRIVAAVIVFKGVNVQHSASSILFPVGQIVKLAAAYTKVNERRAPQSSSCESYC